MKCLLNFVFVICFCWFGCTAGSICQAETFEFHHENILGTSMHLVVQCEDEPEAMRIESWLLEEVARLDKILSRHRSDSELRSVSWDRGARYFISAELAEVLRQAEFSRLVSQGAFDIRVSSIDQLWKSSIEKSRAPTADERNQAIQNFAQSPYSLDGRWLICEQTMDFCPTLDGIAKGFILDELAVNAKAQFPSMAGLSINIGGDLRSIGTCSLRIEIENPFSAAVDSRPIQTIELHRPMGVATSGGYRRFQQLQARRISHLFDPRTALPADQLASVTVISPTACQADALATTISVLGSTEGLKLIEQFDDTACLVITSAGETLQSARWGALVGNCDQLGRDAKPAQLVSMLDTSKPAGLHVWFELAKVGGGSYRRPYVAIWLEDSDGFPVKTSVLWMQTEQPGPRWHRDLTRWYRNDKIRKLAEKTELIGTVSGATRGPGEYEAHFDGTDNAGKLLPDGKYTLLIEAARENGTYQIIREPIELGRDSVEKRELKGNVEISKVAIEYVPTKAN